MAFVAGDLITLVTTGTGASDGSTVVLASLNGRETDQDYGKWVVAILPQGGDDPDLVVFSYVTASSGVPYTLTVVPPFHEPDGTPIQITDGIEVELMAFRPDWYTGAINAAAGNISPWLYKRLYDASITPLLPNVYNYDLPEGVNPEDVTRVMMTGLQGSPFEGVAYYEMAGYTFLPTGTDGAYQLWLNRMNAPFVMTPLATSALVLMGSQQLSGVTPDSDSLAHPMYQLVNDNDPDTGPELIAGSEQDQLFREWVLAYLYRTIMSAPSTPDRTAFAQAYQTQFAYAQSISPAKMMRRPERQQTQ